LNVILELGVGPDGTPAGKALDLVMNGARTRLSDDVVHLVTPRAPIDPELSAAPVWQQFAPMVWLAEDERNLPYSADAFIANSELMWSATPCPSPLLAAAGEVDANKLKSGGYIAHEQLDGCSRNGREWRTNQPSRPKNYDSMGFYLNLRDSEYKGVGSSAPVYVQFKDKEYVIYWLPYAYNDAPAEDWDHEGDWERIGVQLNQHNQPTGVVFWGHDHHCVVPWSTAAKEGDRPVVFSAKGTHASYPKVGTYRFNFVDHTNEGTRWETWRQLKLVEREPWWGYAGGWGDVGRWTNQTGPAGPYPERDVSAVKTTEPCQFR
ncbi:MAG TPA: hypothetical protein DGT23_14670, partial [Micromonosporaceae bacterium]|nr:hypothetical protein [Micromonosporaceae bacterium]